MKIYFAPLEGITGYVYRNVYHAFFPDADKYFMPFLAPHTKRSFNTREKNDLVPVHNEGMYAVPQVLTKSAEDFLMIAEKLKQFGYREININAGCPSGTVVSKNRGAGLLADVKSLNAFLDGIFEKADPDVSVKTRIGMEHPNEFRTILEVYNRYPIHELIIHPRVRNDFYANEPNWDMYEYALEHSRNPLVYNGDIVDMATYRAFKERFPREETIMLGRGVIANPGLIGELRGEAPVSREVLKQFHDMLLAGYQEEMSGDRNVLFKMKEIWVYMSRNFMGADQCLKKLRKTNQLAEYRRITEEMFRTCSLHNTE